MDVWRITVAVLRRWYVFLPLMMLTGFGTILVGEGVNPQYQAAATAILVPGSEPTEVASPYGGIDGTTQALVIVLDSQEARESLAQRGLSRDYEVVAAGDRSSIFTLTVVSPTTETSLATIEAVLELARKELAQRQSAVGMPPAAQIGLQVLRGPSVVDVVTEGKARSMVVVGILGGVISVLVAVLFDDIVGLLKRRGRRRRGRRAAQVSRAASTGRSQPMQSPAGEQPEHPENGRRVAGSHARAAMDAAAEGPPPDVPNVIASSRGR